MREVNIEYVEKLAPIFTRPKRIKILVGGRGSTKSTSVADYVIGRISTGELWCCAREHQNSIEESVHRTILDEIGRLDLSGFDDTKTSIRHYSGGRTFYRGLARNITGLKSTLSGVDGLWIEEGEDLSENTLRVLTASLRRNAADTQRAMAGEDVGMPEIIITMNRGARTGAVAKKWLARAEPDLARCGYYEDDLLMIVQINYTDMPEAWFLNSGLEDERIDDEENMPRAFYRHKWHGDYLDEVDNAIITAEMFDAAIDAHLKLGFEPLGAVVVSHDPSDLGTDAKGLIHRHGSVILDAQELMERDVNDGCDWALGYAIQHQADCFIWDCDGLGVSLRRQVLDAIRGKKIEHVMFKGSEKPANPKAIYQPTDDKVKAKTNEQTFKNKRGQYYWLLRDRFQRTYEAVEKGKYIDPDELISISSEISAMDNFRSEMCRIPLKLNSSGLKQIMSKEEMSRMTPPIPSPNMADSAMMSLANPQVMQRRQFNCASGYG